MCDGCSDSKNTQSNKRESKNVSKSLPKPNRDNLLINFMKVNGTILKDPTNNNVYTLHTSKLHYFLQYTDFNPNNPEASVKVDNVVLDEWLAKYKRDRNPSSDLKILPYIPSTLVSYHNGRERLNYICQITNIVKTAGEDLMITFDTSKVQFTSKCVSTPDKPCNYKNDPSKTKISIDFMEGQFNDIRIDFDPLYDPKYKYNADISFFLQGDLQITKEDGKFIGSMSASDNFIGYRNWSPLESDRNQILEVYTDNLWYLPRMFRTFIDKKTGFTPSTTIEYLDSDMTTWSNIVQIKDMYVCRHTDKSHRVYFELDNKIVKFFNGKMGYKSVSKVLKEGIYYGVRMDIDSVDCGNADSGCGGSVPCHYSWSGMCCRNAVSSCPNAYCSGCPDLFGCGDFG